MMKRVKCECGTITTVNTGKHPNRPKYCRNNLCKRPIDNLNPKVRVNQLKMMLDEGRRQETRARFLARMQRLRVPMQKVAKMLVDPFPWEKPKIEDEKPETSNNAV
jgi:hypothetical protein